MKIRNNTASCGRCISIPFCCVDGQGQNVPKPDCDEAQDKRENGICSSPEPFAVLSQVQRLQAERRECRISATNAEHEDLAERRWSKEASFSSGQCGKETNDERAADVDRQRAPGESLTNAVGDKPRSSPPGKSAETTAYKNPPCIQHTITLPANCRCQELSALKSFQAVLSPQSETANSIADHQLMPETTPQRNTRINYTPQSLISAPCRTRCRLRRWSVRRARQPQR